MRYFRVRFGWPVIGFDRPNKGRWQPLTGTIRAALGCLLACNLLASCAVVKKPESSAAEAPPEPPAQTSSRPPSTVPQQLPPIAILLSDDAPAYQRIADQVAARITNRADVLLLGGEPSASVDVGRQLESTAYEQVIAIGPRAARTARKLTVKQVVFCQVFNYEEHGLTAAHMQGVSVLPPVELQFRAWKSLAPEVQRIGVIVGPGHETLIAQARAAARKHGIELIHRIVRSDKEMLYEFKRLTPEIEGLWLLPDDRVLSRRVLREVMTYSAKHGKQVVVFHPELLRLDGLMSLSSVESDIAEQVVAALRAEPGHVASSASSPLPLTKIHIEINPRIAQELGVAVPPRLQVLADAP